MVQTSQNDYPNTHNNPNDDSYTSKLQRDTADLRRQIVQLELEAGRLRDEATLNALKHHEEVKYLQGRHQTETDDVYRRKDLEVGSLIARHAEAVAALKKVGKG